MSTPPPSKGTEPQSRGLLGLPARVWSAGEQLGWQLCDLRVNPEGSISASFVRSGSREEFSVSVSARDPSKRCWLRLSRVQASYSGDLGETDRSHHAWKRWIVEVLARGSEALASAAPEGTSFLEAIGRRSGHRSLRFDPEAILELLSPHWTVGEEVFGGLRLAGARRTATSGPVAIELLFEGTESPSVVLVPRAAGAGARRGGAHIVVAERAGITSAARDRVEALVGFAIQLQDSETIDFVHANERPRADTFCVLPWTMLDVKPQGQILPCDLFARALVSDEGEPMDVRRHSLASAWASADLARVRKAHASGERIPECDRCWHVEAKGGKSRRTRYLDELSQFVPLAEAGQAKLAFLSFFPGNLCNLRCRTCTPASSSALTREMAEVSKLMVLRGGPAIPSEPAVSENWLRESPVFWESIDEVFSELKQIEFLGGEPLVIDQHHDLLTRLVESGHAGHVALRYVTNGTRVPARAAELWPHFERVGLQVSLDGIGPRFEYLRHPARWEAVVGNIDRFRTIAGRVDVTTNATFSLISAYYVHEVFEWTRAKGLKFSLNSFGDPRHLDPRALTSRAKREVRERLTDPALPIDASERPNVAGLLELMDSEDWSAQELPIFWLRTRAHDEYRGERFEAVFPELAALLDDPSP